MNAARYLPFAGRLLIGLAFAMSGLGKLAAYGATIDLIKRRKIEPRRPRLRAGAGKSTPNTIPATSPAKIQVVSEGFFTCLPTGVFREERRRTSSRAAGSG